MALNQAFEKALIDGDPLAIFLGKQYDAAKHDKAWINDKDLPRAIRPGHIVRNNPNVSSQNVERYNRLVQRLESYAQSSVSLRKMAPAIRDRVQGEIRKEVGTYASLKWRFTHSASRTACDTLVHLPDVNASRDVELVHAIADLRLSIQSGRNFQDPANPGNVDNKLVDVSPAKQSEELERLEAILEEKFAHIDHAFDDIRGTIPQTLEMQRLIMATKAAHGSKRDHFLQ